MNEKYNCLIDLHLHLDGAVSLNSARKLAKLNKISVPDSDEELCKLIMVDEKSRDLDEFLEKFNYLFQFFQTYDSLKMATENLIKELEEEGHIYAEIRFAPQFCTAKGLSQEDAVKAVLEGFKVSHIPLGLILCGIRFKDNENANMETLLLADKYRDKGVCAYDLAASEEPYHNIYYKTVLDKANELEIPLTLHAGEGSGPENVYDSLKLGAVRIGHGVRSYEDSNLLKMLADRKIPLELCPTSNLKTSVFKEYAEYPLKQFIDAGVIITINTDDPGVEGTTLTKELNILKDTFGLSGNDIKRFLINAANSAFTTETIKNELLKKINESNL